MMSRDRRSLLSDASFRAHLVLVVTGTTAALLVVGSAAILLPLLLQFEGSATGSPQDLGRLADRILALHSTLWPLVAICLGGVLVSSWLLYQRMVSPMVRFVQVFRSIEAGALPGAIQLRATDYLAEEAAVLNEMTASLRERHTALCAAEERLRSGIEDLAEQIEQSADAESARLVATAQDLEKLVRDQIQRVSAA
ncbi:hypothetical protein MYXO_01113 [Myxococcaceae bacterium]|nr:hypothetical protein MYXO_01113 [Myxococcaceae bacterium]